MKPLLAALVVLALSLPLVHAQQFPQIQQLLSGKRLDEAEQQIQQGLERFPHHPELLYWKSAVEWERGRTAEAIETLEGVLERGHASPPHYELLGHIHKTREDWGKAVLVYSQALNKTQIPGFALDLGLSQFRLGRFEDAIATLGPLGEDANPQALHLLGLSHFALQNLADAASSLERSLRLDASNPSVHYDLGLVYLQAERFGPAVERFREAARLRPDWAEAQLYLGRALHDSNLAEDALQAFQTALRLNPDLPLLHHHFGLLYKGRGDYDRAVEEFEKELAGGMEFAATCFHLSEILYNRDQKERSSRLLARALELEPQNPEYRLQAVKQALAVKDLDGAAEHLEQALALDPLSSSAHYLKGRLLQAQGKLEQARAAFEQARRLGDQKSRRAVP